MPLIHVTRAGVLDDIGTLRQKGERKFVCMQTGHIYHILTMDKILCFFVLNLNTNWNVSRVDSTTEYTLLYAVCSFYDLVLCIISTGLFSYQLQLVSCKMKMDLFVPYRCCCCCCFFFRISHELFYIYFNFIAFHYIVFRFWVWVRSLLNVFDWV